MAPLRSLPSRTTSRPFHGAEFDRLETASFIKPIVAHALAGNNVNAAGAGGGGKRRKGIDQRFADAPAAIGSSKINVQVRREPSTMGGKVRAIIVKIAEPWLLGGIFQASDQVAGEHFANDGHHDGIAGCVEIAPEPTIAEPIAVRSGHKGATTRLQADALNLLPPGRWQVACHDDLGLDDLSLDDLRANGLALKTRGRGVRSVTIWHGALPGAA